MFVGTLQFAQAGLNFVEAAREVAKPGIEKTALFVESFAQNEDENPRSEDKEQCEAS
jgi:hypothetical protein